MKKVILFIVIVILMSLAYFNLFGAPGGDGREDVLVIPKQTETFDIVTELRKKNLIKNEAAFRFITDRIISIKKYEPGGYRLNRRMTAFDVAKKLAGKPDLVWVSINACLRKEQIGEILAEELEWDRQELEKWNAVYESDYPEYFEGVYYPDTYLLPRDESGDKIASRFIARFNEVFAPYAQRYLQQNIRWVTGLKIASLIAREAAGSQDMRLISGIIWNRLDIGMPLQIDATMQYTAGKRPDGSWWGTIDIDEKLKDSPYNSYLYKGLPPTPICSPNIEYIEAVLEPEETDCLFYLHDYNGQIHCSVTYEEHLEKIDQYL